VIAYDRGACREVVADGKTGFIVSPVDEAANAVSKTATIDPKGCREHVEENFSIAKMVEGYEKVYEEVFRREEV